MDELTTTTTAITIAPAGDLLATAALPASQNAAIVYLASLAEGSRPTMRQALNVTASLLAPGATLDDVPWGALRFAHTQAIRALLAERYDAATANKMLSALRQTLKRAWRLGQMTAEEYMAAADVDNVKGEKPDQAAGRALTLGEIMALVTACNDGTPRGARDAALLGVAYTAGLRRAEIAKLDLADVNLVAGMLVAHGKRNKVRTVPLERGALAALLDWVAVRGDASGPLFVQIGKGGRVTGERLTGQAVWFVLQERAERAGVRAFTPHDLRRTFAGDLLDAGADIATVQRLMGHANVNTTAGYDRRGERAKQEAVKRLHYPYQGSG